jgi:hypothetical protein
MNPSFIQARLLILILATGFCLTGGPAVLSIAIPSPERIPSTNSHPELAPAGDIQATTVIDFGADPTGIRDSTIAFQAAIDSLSSPRIPRGIYSVAGNIHFNGPRYNGKRFIGEGVDTSIIQYIGEDYLFKYNDNDSLANTVRRGGICGVSIRGNKRALGAIQIQASSELIFDNIYIQDFSNPKAKVVMTTSKSDSAWGLTFRNVTIKNCPQVHALWWMSQFTWMLLDHCYANGGSQPGGTNAATFGMVVGPGSAITMISPAIEGCVYGLVFSTGIGTGPLGAANIINANIESCKFHVDINHAIAPSDEYVYGVTIDGAVIGGPHCPTGELLIQVGKARNTYLRGCNLFSPNQAPSPLLTILPLAEDTRIETVWFSGHGGHSPLKDQGNRTKMTQLQTGYIPIWSSTGSSPALGNGILSGEYSLEGLLCTVNLTWIAGTTTQFGTGEYRFSLPFVANPANRSIGQAILHDVQSNRFYPGIVMVDAHSNTIKVVVGSGGGLMDSKNPIIQQATHRLDLTITYPIYRANSN